MGPGAWGKAPLGAFVRLGFWLLGQSRRYRQELKAHRERVQAEFKEYRAEAKLQRRAIEKMMARMDSHDRQLEEHRAEAKVQRRAIEVLLEEVLARRNGNPT